MKKNYNGPGSLLRWTATVLMLFAALLLSSCGAEDLEAPLAAALAEYAGEIEEGSDQTGETIAQAGEDLEDVVESASFYQDRETEEKVDDKNQTLEEADRAAGPSEDQADAGDQTGDKYVFRSRKLLDSHYEKHGYEMGFDSPWDYQRAASRVAENPDSLHKTEKEDGDDVYYLEATNEFVVVSTDGYLRTYFLPDRGKSYFDRQ